MIRAATRHDIPELKNLFRICFDDTDEFLDLFFTEYFKNTTCMVAIRDERIVSMLFLCPAKMNDGVIRRTVYYVYACATLPAYRKKGIMEQLLQVSHTYAKQEGAWGLILVPASDDLAYYYEKLGFVPFSCYEEQEAIPSSDKNLFLPESCELSVKQITAIRNRRFRNDYQVQWRSKHLVFNIDMLQQQGGGSLGIRWKSGRKDYILYEKTRRGVTVKETSADETAYTLLTSFLCNHFGVSAVSYFVPVRQGELFSMVKPVDMFELSDNAMPYFNLEMG